MKNVISLCIILITCITVTSIRILPFDVSDSATEYINFTSFNHLRRRLTDRKNHLVDSIPSLKGNIVTNYAGHLFVEGDHSALFYWLFEASSSPATAPLIIWMNGGPGCSSMDGLFLELGPLKIVNNEVTLNPHSWHNIGNLLFIDQPVGTGLSYTTRGRYPKNDEELSEHFYKMLLEFFKLHSNYVTPGMSGRVSRKVFLTGESHAGHYLPVFAKHILQKNAAATGPDDLVIDLGGVAIGNGWVDPYNQYDVSEFMHGLGVLSLGQKYTLKEKERACRGMLKKGVLNSQKCFALLDDIIATTGTSSTGRMVMYDAREVSKTRGSYPPGHEDVERYLNRKDVRTALHAQDTPQPFKECTDPPYNALSHQDGKGAVDELTMVLEAGVRVLMFAGQFDIICNHLGTERMLNRLKWKGRDAWLRASTSEFFSVGVSFDNKNMFVLCCSLCVSVPWAPNNNHAGFVRRALNLQHLVVSNAGHMVNATLYSACMLILVANASNIMSGSSLQTSRGARYDPTIRKRHPPGCTGN